LKRKTAYQNIKERMLKLAETFENTEVNTK